MKIALVQPDVENKKIAKNAALLAEMCKTAWSGGANLCIAPMEALCGPLEEAERKELVAAGESAGQFLAHAIPKNQTLVCALPNKTFTPVVIANGSIYKITKEFEFEGINIEVEYKRTLDACFKMQNMAKQPNSIFIYLASHSYAPDKQQKVEELITRQAAISQTLVLAANLTGGYGEKVYSGQSAAAMPDIGIIARGKSFAEDILIMDYPCSSHTAIALYTDSRESQWQALLTGTRDFLHKRGAKKAVIGLSGGMDSAFVACVAKEALGPENVLGILMPSQFSSKGSIDDSLALAHNLGIETRTIPIEPMVETFKANLSSALDAFVPVGKDLTFENLQARIRGVILMAIANRSGAFVLNTGNKSELSMGYCTLYGDAVGALAVIGDLYKTRVYELARWYNEFAGFDVIPEEIFRKEPSAELAPGQKDTDSLPPYSELDAILTGLEKGKMPKETELASKWQEIKARVEANQFKRNQCPPVLKVD